jgi:hypothetical protein
MVSPILCPTTHSVKNSVDFVEKIKHIKVNPGHIMMSCDVTAMFTSLPVDKTLFHFSKALDECGVDKFGDLSKTVELDLVKLCLEDNNFIFDNVVYKQCTGLFIGNPLSPLLSSLYMDTIDKQINNHTFLKPVSYFRYVDDIWAVIKKSQLRAFQRFVNCIDPCIQFTFEVEENGCIPFLDTLVFHEADSLLTKVFRKQIYSGIFLNYKSHHDLSQKIGLIYTFVRRAVKICFKKSDLDEELDVLYNLFLNNGYPVHIVKKHIKKAVCKFSTPAPVHLPGQNTNNKKYYISYPYIPTSDRRVREVCNQANIIMGKTAGTKIKDLCNNYKHKDKPHHVSNVVYKLDCGGCSKKYVGETGRRVSFRVDEHRRACKNNNLSNMTAVHEKETGHRFDFSHCSIVGRNSNTNR